MSPEQSEAAADLNDYSSGKLQPLPPLDYQLVPDGHGGMMMRTVESAADFAKRHRAKAQVAEGIEFEPAWDYILLEPIIKEKTGGGIALPEGAKTADDTGRSIVVAVGPGTYREDGTFVPVPVVLGDIVYNMTRMHSFKVIENKKTYICISARDMVGFDRSGKLREGEIRARDFKPSSIIQPDPERN